MFTNKKILFSLLIALIISCFIPSKGYAKTDGITIGTEISDTSSDIYRYEYTLILKRKMKIKISVSVDGVKEEPKKENEEPKKENDEEDDYYDYYEDDEEDDYYFDDYYSDDFEEKTNSIIFSMYEDDYYKPVINDWEINAGEKKTKTVVLKPGTYFIYVEGNVGGLDYTFSTQDKSTYTKKITMVNKLNILAGDSKKITVKSKESGKYLGEVIWTSSNKKIATVDSNGNVKGIKQGSCVISAKTKNSNTVKCKVTIKARPKLYITGAGFDINFLGGVEPYITFQNNFGKTIKYIYLNVYFYNKVGDKAYCEIQNKYYGRLKITGPIKNKVSDTYYWDAVIYNDSTGKMYLKTAEIEFMDGTKKKVSIKKSYKY